jgi:hypothetical protein
VSETARTAADASSSSPADLLIRISADVVLHRDVLCATTFLLGSAVEKGAGRMMAQLALDLDDEC